MQYKIKENKKIAIINIILSLAILVALFLPFEGILGASSITKIVISLWAQNPMAIDSKNPLLGIVEYLIGNLYMSCLVLSIFGGAIASIIIEIINLKNKTNNGYGMLCFGPTLIISFGFALEYTIFYLFIYRLIICTIIFFIFQKFGANLPAGFFISGSFLLPVLIGFHIIFNYRVNDKIEKEEKAEATKNIVLQEGYQFSKISYSVLVEKIGEKGVYYCPFCLKRNLEKDTVCSSCGKGLYCSDYLNLDEEKEMEKD